MDRSRLERATQVLQHRGPDDAGVYLDGRVGLGHRRLSVIDLSEAGLQPMLSVCKRYVLVYNGELYNAPALRDRLKRPSYRGHSDTEVLLEALIEYGATVLSELNGMFSFAFLDRHEQTLLLARDRFGIKPLYYAEDNGELCFASEIKAILACSPQSRSMRESALNEYLYYGTTLGTRTLYAGIHRLLPAQAMHIDLQSGVHKRWEYVSAPGTRHDKLSVAEAAAHVKDLLAAAVARHMVSDVPVSVFLSGGIDSSAVTAFAARHADRPLTTYAVGFDDVPGGADELPYARQVAAVFGTRHEELLLNIGTARTTIERLIDIHDSPFADAASIPLYLLSQAVSGRSKVVLQGDGGDEMFGGYNRYRWLSSAKSLRAMAQLAPLLSRVSARSQSLLRAQRVLDAFREPDARLMALLLTEERIGAPPTQVLSRELRESAERSSAFRRYEELNRQYAAEPLAQRMLYTDARILLPDYFLEKVDRSTMAFGIEARTPFLDTQLSDFVMSLPATLKLDGGRQKALLKTALADVLPHAILNRPKSGFYVPYKDWMKGALGDWLLEIISDPQVSGTRVFDSDRVSRLLSEHRQDKGRWGFLLYKTLMLALWLRRGAVTA